MARTRYLICCEKVQVQGDPCVSCKNTVMPRVNVPHSQIQIYKTDNVGSKAKGKGPRYSYGLDENLPKGEGRAYVDRRTQEKFGTLPVWDSDPRKLRGRRISLNG